MAGAYPISVRTTLRARGGEADRLRADGLIASARIAATELGMKALQQRIADVGE